MFDEELWEEGFFYQCSMKKNSLCMDKNLLKKSNQFKAVYLSNVLDSNEKETVWHRMRMQFTVNNESNISFSYFATDDNQIVYHGQKIKIDAVLKDDELSIMDKLVLLDSFWIEGKINPSDIFLFEAKGRYFLFKIELTAFDQFLPSINSLKIEFPMNTIADYLPEFYRTSKEGFSFLTRFLGVFQTMIDDMEDKIDTVSKYFDADACSGAFLKSLSMWLDIDNSFLLKEEKLKQVIKNSFLLYAEKGTKKGLSDMIELYTDKKPLIAETFKIMECFENGIYPPEYESLYGKDIYSFFLFLSETAVPSQKHFIELKKLTEAFKPANTEAHIVVLKPFIVLGQHSYIGLNSSLSDNRVLELSGDTILPFNTTILE